MRRTKGIHQVHTKCISKQNVNMPHQKPKRVRHQKEEINMKNQNDEDKKNERLFDFLEFLVLVIFIILLFYY